MSALTNRSWSDGYKERYSVLSTVKKIILDHETECKNREADTFKVDQILHNFDMNFGAVITKKKVFAAYQKMVYSE